MTPTDAAKIWTIGDELHVEFPPLGNNMQTNTIKLPATEKGFLALLSILRARENESRKTIGTKATPNQWNTEALLKAFGGTITRIEAPVKAKATLTLEDLDL